MNKDMKTNYPNLEVNTDYQEQSIYLEPLQEVEYIQSLYDKGLMPPLDYVKRLTGNVLIKTNEDAIKFINDNKAYNENSIESNSGAGGNDEPVQPETKEQQIQTTLDVGAREEQSIGRTNN